MPDTFFFTGNEIARAQRGSEKQSPQVDAGGGGDAGLVKLHKAAAHGEQRQQQQTAQQECRTRNDQLGREV